MRSILTSLFACLILDAAHPALAQPRDLSADIKTVILKLEAATTYEAREHASSALIDLVRMAPVEATVDDSALDAMILSLRADRPDTNHLGVAVAIGALGPRAARAAPVFRQLIEAEHADLNGPMTGIHKGVVLCRELKHISSDPLPTDCIRWQ